MSSRFSAWSKTRAWLLLLVWPSAALAAAVANACDTRILASDFPGRLVIDVNSSEIGIGAIGPFAGGSGRIVAAAGALLDGGASLEFKPEAFAIDPFDFPFVFDWETKLTAENRGNGLIEFDDAGDRGAISLKILLKASNRLGRVWMDAEFTTSAPGGAPLDLATGRARLVARGQTEARSHMLFRGEDFYASTEVCLYFADAG